MKRLTIRRIAWAIITLSAAFVLCAGSWIWWVKSERGDTEKLLRATVLEKYSAIDIPLEEAIEKWLSQLKESDERFQNFTINWNPLLDTYEHLPGQYKSDDQIMGDLAHVNLDFRDRNGSALEIADYLCRLSNLRFDVNPNELAITTLHSSGRPALENAWDQLWWKIIIAWEDAIDSSPDHEAFPASP